MLIFHEVKFINFKLTFSLNIKSQFLIWKNVSIKRYTIYENAYVNVSYFPVRPVNVYTKYAV